MQATIRRWSMSAALAALAGTVSTASAGDRPRLDQALAKKAPEVVAFLKAANCKAVGVLPFLARVGDGPLRDDLGPLHRNLARRLEVALILALPDDSITVISGAGDAVAASGNTRATHRSPSGRAQFFRINEKLFHPAWGDKPVRPDVFLTGEAVLAPDWKSLTIKVQAFDEKDSEQLRLVCDIPAKVDARTLTEAGVSYARPRGAKDDDSDEPLAQGPKYLPAPLVPEASKPRDPNQAFADLLKQSPVRLEILYNGKPVEIRGGVLARTPEPTDTVTFRLTNDRREPYGAVLKVNGENTIFREDADPLDCCKWILKPDRQITVEGFQKDDFTREAFDVKPPAESKGYAVQYGPHAGTISMVVFRAQEKDDEAVVKNEAMQAKEYLAIARGTAAPKGVRPTNLLALKAELAGDVENAAARSRGLIVPGAEAAGEIKREPFAAYPRPVVSLTIRYYQPK